MRKHIGMLKRNGIVLWILMNLPHQYKGQEKGKDHLYHWTYPVVIQMNLVHPEMPGKCEDHLPEKKKKKKKKLNPV